MKCKLFLIFLLCVAVLCGCSDSDAAPQTGEETNVSEETLVEETQVIDYAAEAAELREAIDGAESGSGLSSFGEWTPDEEAMKALDAEIGKLTDAGYDLGFVMIDAASGKGVAFNADQQFCSQSTIKGPYIASTYEVKPECFEEKKDKISSVLKYSDNDAYRSLRQTYLSDGFKEWINTTGLRPELCDNLYVVYSAREFAKLWTEMYRFFHTTDNQELCDLYIGSRYSATYYELGNDYTVRSKAGWEDGIYGGSSPLPECVDKDPYNDEVATNDGALVEAENGEYIFVILSDVPADFRTLQPLVRAVDDLHKTM